MTAYRCQNDERVWTNSVRLTNRTPTLLCLIFEWFANHLSASQPAVRRAPSGVLLWQVLHLVVVVVMVSLSWLVRKFCNAAPTKKRGAKRKERQDDETNAAQKHPEQEREKQGKKRQEETQTRIQRQTKGVSLDRSVCVGRRRGRGVIECEDSQADGQDKTARDHCLVCIVHRVLTKEGRDRSRARYHTLRHKTTRHETKRRGGTQSAKDHGFRDRDSDNS